MSTDQHIPSRLQIRQNLAIPERNGAVYCVLQRLRQWNLFRVQMAVLCFITMIVQVILGHLWGTIVEATPPSLDLLLPIALGQTRLGMTLQSTVPTIVSETILQPTAIHLHSLIESPAFNHWSIDLIQLIQNDPRGSNGSLQH